MKLKKLAQVISLICIATPAAAQQASPAPTAEAQKVQKVEVTGSSIKRVQDEGALPIQVITREDIDRAGITSAEQLLASITSNGTGADNLSSNTGIQFSNTYRNNNGNTSANLRGLGASSTLVLLNEQIGWMLGNGGLSWCAARCSESARALYSWADQRSWANPFVVDPSKRSDVVGTIDIEGVDATAVCAALRVNGIVDTDSYRKLGRNQLRVGMFPAIEPSDVVKLAESIDYVVDVLQ